MSEPMYEPIAKITWCGEDVKAIYPDWSDEKCISALESVAGYLEERSVELGWEVLQILLDDYKKEEDEDDN